MTIQLRIATPQDAPLIHDTFGHYVIASTATFNEINPSVEERAGEIQKQLETYPWLISGMKRAAFWATPAPNPSARKQAIAILPS